MADGSDRVVQITFNDHTLVLRLADGCLLTVPLAWFPRLLQAPDDARGNWRVAGTAGNAILWPDIGEALNVASLLKRGQEHNG
jgi:hypothetical protein